MTPEDLRLFCTALGFTAIATKQDLVATDQAQRALRFAALIEAFCLQSVPDPDAAANAEDATRLDTVIERLKSDMRFKGAVNVQNDRATLLQIYDRLRQRFSAYASDGMIADRVLEMLNAELYYGIPVKS